MGAKTRIRLGVVAAAGALSLLGAAACQRIIGLVDPEIDQPTDDASSDTGAPVDSDTGADVVVDPCAHVTAPPPPAVDDDPNVSLPPIVFAIHLVHMTGRITDVDGGTFDASGLGLAPRIGFGFDMDNACTCGNDLFGGVGSCIGPTTACDGEGGTDNAFKGLFAGLSAFGAIDLSVGANEKAATGELTAIMTVKNYNGRANDQDVSFVSAVARRPSQSPDPTCGPDAGDRPALEGGAGFMPLWDGCDQWPTTSPSTTSTAYVTNHVLVVASAATVPLPFGGAAIDIVAPTLAGVLLPHADGTFSLEDVVLGGRAPANNALRAVAGLTSQSGTTPLCALPPIYSLIRGELCSSRDIMSSKVEDRMGLPCDALSLALGFRADPAKLGDAGDAASTALVSCDDAGADLTCTP